MLRRILALMIKEFIAIVVDPKSRIVLIGPPIIQLMVFGYAATFDLEHVTYAVYNEDSGRASRDLLSRLEGSRNFHRVAVVRSDREVRPLIDNREVMAVVHIGPRFSAHMLQGRPGSLQVIVDGRNSNTAMIVLNYVRNIVTAFNRDWAESHGESAPSELRVRFWFNANLDSRWFIVPGLVALLTLVVSLLLTALSVAREREAGTFDQMLATPLRPVEILIGKALPGFIIGMAEATFILLMAIFWFEVPFRGAIAPLYLGLVVFLLSAVGVGLMISSLSVTQQQALLGTFLFLVPAIILSGFSTPIANMPPAVQYLTYLNPMRYFLIIVRSVFLEAASFDLIWNLYWPMALIGLLSLVAAGWLFRRRMY
ncbi:MAG: ABC transporter permease [Deltaproteobacteria bacterium]|jgi:ABC-2 type transport system permease protein